MIHASCSNPVKLHVFVRFLQARHLTAVNEHMDYCHQQLRGNPLAWKWAVKTVLSVIDTTGPGGAETVFIDLAARLPGRGYRSLVLVRGKGWVYEELCRRRLRPVILDAKGSFNWRYLLALCRLIRREGVDLIQSHLLGSNVYCSIAGLLTGTPVVATFHGSVDIGENERFKWLKSRAIQAGAVRIIAVSSVLQQDILARTRLPKARLQVIYNGIDTTVFCAGRTGWIRQKFGWTQDEIIVGSLGNIRPAKAYDILLHAAALLLDSSNNRYRFVIAGEGRGKLFESLLVLRKELNLVDKVIFLGFLDDAAGFLPELDIFLSTSISEGLPLSAIQAMASGLPLVVPRCGGYEELISDRVNGLLFETGNITAIADTIEIAATDTALRAVLAENARRHAVDTFDIQAMLQNYLRVYEELLQARSGA